MEREIEETVMEILNKVDIEKTSEFKVRKMAGEKLGVDLSGSDHKMFVRKIVESFLLAKKQEQDEAEAAALAAQQQQEDQDQKEVLEDEEEEEEEEEEESKKAGGVTEKEYDDDGDLIICRLSNKRRVTIQDFRGKTLVSMREYYEKDGRELPSSKGISLTAEQWAAFRKAVPSIEEAIRKLESRST